MLSQTHNRQKVIDTQQTIVHADRFEQVSCRYQKFITATNEHTTIFQMQPAYCYLFNLQQHYARSGKTIVYCTWFITIIWLQNHNAQCH